MFGFNLVPLNDIVLERMNGIKDISTTRSPKDCLFTFEPTSSLVIPFLVCVPVLPSAIVLVLPAVVFVLQRPVQFVCHSFHTVPMALPIPTTSLNDSNIPLSFTIKSGLLTISFHSSTSGVNATSP